MEKVTILIPVYNEKAALPKVIEDVKKAMKNQQYGYEILVVDDGSTDDSAQIAESLGVRVVRHPVNCGIGAARTSGVEESATEFIVMIDGDCTYPADAIPELLKEMQENDMVVGARRKEKGTFKILRTFAKLFIKALASYLVKTRIPDLNSGLRVVKKSLVLKYKKYLPVTHSWVSTITLVMLSRGYKVRYVSIDYHPRVGKSTFHPLRDSYNYLSLVVRTIMYFNPLRFFLPLSLIVFFTGVAKSVLDFVTTHTIQESDIILLSTAVIVFAIGLLADLIVMMHKE